MNIKDLHLLVDDDSHTIVDVLSPYFCGKTFKGYTCTKQPGHPGNCVARGCKNRLLVSWQTIRKGNKLIKRLVRQGKRELVIH